MAVHNTAVRESRLGRAPVLGFELRMWKLVGADRIS